ncbi:MAG: coenzyme F420 biosynthesis-associated protein [Actinobacteria bacterium]|uniref:Unannotated protein n=1 Tax=freshwater metagenome TaxID=449393 RepID=A0A6J7D5H8_9ZZZZ|nr:coenzyme F420 biosynthesis-associated protein [Actinomycetota bacterium]
MSDSIDWNLAVATASRLAPRGPELPRAQARDAVLMLRDLAAEAVEPVRRVTGLEVAGDGGAMVVDRPAWIASNVAGMRIAMTPLLERLDETEPPALIRDLGSRGTALQVGAVLAWLSGKVLGQYEVFTPPGERGRLLLVAPTIVNVERQLQVPSRDFRLWVCLHEETHRVQFGAVPWLADYLASLVAEFLEVSEVGIGQVVKAVAQAVRSVVPSSSSSSSSSTGPRESIIEAIQSPEQRAVFDRITGLMSLLEGHADVVMDDVGPQIIPSVELIRTRFTERRQSPSAIDGLARKVLGMDAKLRQYTEGAAFVRHVTGEIGMAGFNGVWASPSTLPTRAEIRDPQLWLSRMAG